MDDEEDQDSRRSGSGRCGEASEWKMQRRQWSVCAFLPVKRKTSLMFPRDFKVAHTVPKTLGQALQHKACIQYTAYIALSNNRSWSKEVENATSRLPVSRLVRPFHRAEAETCGGRLPGKIREDIGTD